MSNIIDPKSLSLVFTGQSAIGSGGGMPTEGVHAITVTEASIRQSERGYSLWVTLSTDGGHKLYDYHSLPTAENAAQQTKFGTKAEFFEKKLKAVLVALGHDAAGVKNMNGAPSAQQIIDLVQNHKGFIYYRPPVGSGKHQIDHIGASVVDKVRSGEVTFQDRRSGGSTGSAMLPAMPPAIQPTMLAASPNVGAIVNSMTTPQPIPSTSVVSSIVGL